MNPSELTPAMLRCMHHTSERVCQHLIPLSHGCPKCKRKGPDYQTEGWCNVIRPTQPARTEPASVPAVAKPAKESTTHFVIPGAPMGKPRQTQRDKWQKRPCVVRYRAWADKARAAAPKDLPIQPLSVSWVAYLPLPKSWRKPLQDAMRGQLHRHKPDRDNIDKAVCDALWKDDSVIALGSLEKRWDDGKGPRIEVTVSHLLATGPTDSTRP